MYLGLKFVIYSFYMDNTKKGVSVFITLYSRSDETKYTIVCVYITLFIY